MTKRRIRKASDGTTIPVFASDDEMHAWVLFCTGALQGGGLRTAAYLADGALKELRRRRPR